MQGSKMGSPPKSCTLISCASTLHSETRVLVIPTTQPMAFLYRNIEALFPLRNHPSAFLLSLTFEAGSHVAQALHSL